MSTSPTPKPVADTSFVCACELWNRSACEREQFYKECEGKCYCVLHFPGKQKSEAFKQALLRKIESKDFDFRGIWFPDVSFEEFDFGTAAADFGHATFTEKANFSRARFGAANFDFVRFNAAANFTSASFSQRTQFTSARFLQGAYFNHATFSDVVDFGSARFCMAAYFGYASFQAADFSNASFSASLADFSGASFSGAANFTCANFDEVAEFGNASFSAEAYFTNASFRAAVNFSYATFKNHIIFAGKEAEAVFAESSYLDLRFARIEKPELMSFHTITLRPGWFVNIDARKFEFSNVDWYWRSINKEIASLQNSEVSSPYRMLAIAYRHLAVNAEENHRYEEASNFRYMAMDTRRLKWIAKLKGKFFLGHWRVLSKAVIRLTRSGKRHSGAPRRRLLRVKRYAAVYSRGLDVLHWFYWALSGYGERVLRAAVVLIGILILSAALYTQVGFGRWEPRITGESEPMTTKRDDFGAPLKLSRALTYGAEVMTVQRPEPRPLTTAAHTIVLLETILGPVQAALLALAIRRRFMR